MLRAGMTKDAPITTFLIAPVESLAAELVAEHGYGAGLIALQRIARLLAANHAKEADGLADTILIIEQLLSRKRRLH